MPTRRVVVTLLRRVNVDTDTEACAVYPSAWTLRSARQLLRINQATLQVAASRPFKGPFRVHSRNQRVAYINLKQLLGFQIAQLAHMGGDFSLKAFTSSSAHIILISLSEQVVQKTGRVSSGNPCALYVDLFPAEAVDLRNDRIVFPISVHSLINKYPCHRLSY